MSADSRQLRDRGNRILVADLDLVGEKARRAQGVARCSASMPRITRVNGRSISVKASVYSALSMTAASVTSPLCRMSACCSRFTIDSSCERSSGASG